MRKAGDLLSAILDEKTLGKAREYSKLFSAWEQLTKKHGIAAAAYHSRIQDIKRGVLLTEADHPGWIQLLQTKEHLLLSDLQRTFPDLGITGIAFMLSKAPPASADSAAAWPGNGNTAPAGAPVAAKERPAAAQPAEEAPAADSRADGRSGYDRIKDGSFKDKLKSLEKSIKLKI